jgi:uncharacterized protein (TIGR02145 family)
MNLFIRHGRALLLATAVVLAVGLSVYGGDTYESVTIGGKKWMKKNLNIKTDSSWCYGEGSKVRVGVAKDEDLTLSNSEIQANCVKYGRLYTWNAAKTACPSGWHLPTLEERDLFYSALGGYFVACKKLKAKSGWNNKGNGTDNYGFSALPGGARYSGSDDYRGESLFSGAGYFGDWWTASEENEYSAYYMVIDYDCSDEGVYEDDDNKSYARSVRCVKDD